MINNIIPVKCEVCGGPGHGWGRVCEHCNRFICNKCWQSKKETQINEYPDCMHRLFPPKQSDDLLDRIEKRFKKKDES